MADKLMNMDKVMIAISCFIFIRGSLTKSESSLMIKVNLADHEWTITDLIDQFLNNWCVGKSG